MLTTLHFILDPHTNSQTFRLSSNWTKSSIKEYPYEI